MVVAIHLVDSISHSLYSGDQNQGSRQKRLTIIHQWTWQLLRPISIIIYGLSYFSSARSALNCSGFNDVCGRRRALRSNEYSPAYRQDRVSSVTVSDWSLWSKPSSGSFPSITEAITKHNSIVENRKKKCLLNSSIQALRIQDWRGMLPVSHPIKFTPTKFTLLNTL